MFIRMCSRLFMLRCERGRLQYRGVVEAVDVNCVRLNWEETVRV